MYAFASMFRLRNVCACACVRERERERPRRRGCREKQEKLTEIRSDQGVGEKCGKVELFIWREPKCEGLMIVIKLCSREFMKLSDKGEVESL